MVSIWFVVLALVVGTFAGMFVFALSAMAGTEEEDAAKAEQALNRNGLQRLELGPEWNDSDRWSARFG